MNEELAKRLVLYFLRREPNAFLTIRREDVLGPGATIRTHFDGDPEDPDDWTVLTLTVLPREDDVKH